MTGSASPPVFAGVHTLRYRQSSLISGGAPKIRAKVGSCMQLGPNVDACLTPVHGFTGWGARQRSAPTGGAANGMPLNDTMPFASTPATRPPVTSTSRTCAPAGGPSHTMAAAHTTPIDSFFINNHLSLSWTVPVLRKYYILRDFRSKTYCRINAAHGCYPSTQ